MTDAVDEQILIAELITNGDNFKLVSGVIDNSTFKYDVNQEIFDALGYLSGKDRGFDWEDIAVLCPAIGEMGRSYLTDLLKLSSNRTNYEVTHLARTLTNERRKERLDECLTEALQSDDRVEFIISRIKEEIAEIDVSAGIKIKTSQDTGAEIIEDLEKELPCYKTGLSGLDSLMQGGVYKTRTYYVCARPKNGKTMLLGTMSQNFNKIGCKHLFIAAEMGSKQIHQRVMAREINRNTISFVTDRKDKGFISDIMAAQRADNGNVYYYDAPSIKFEQLQSAILYAVRKHGINGVLLDYLGLVTGRGRTSEADFQAEVAQWLAKVARDENIFVICAAQINREGSIRGSDGALMAADQVYHLQMTEKDHFGKRGAWMEMLASRYTEQQDLGNEMEPGLVLKPTATHFEDF
jgi:replicative DNA helicase